MTISVLGSSGSTPTQSNPDTSFMAIANHSSVGACCFELAVWDEKPSGQTAWEASPSLGGKTPSYSYPLKFLNLADAIHTLVIFVWEFDKITDMTGYNVNGFSPQFYDGVAINLSDPSYFYRTIGGGSDLVVRDIDKDGSNAASTTVTTDTFTAVEGDFFSSYIKLYTGSGQCTAVTNHTEDFDLNYGSNEYRAHLYSYDVGAGGYDGALTVTYSTAVANAKNWAVIQYSDTPLTVTYNRVLSSNFIVTDAQPGQIVSGNRPGERINVFDMWSRRAVGHILHDVLAVHDELQYSAVNVVNRQLLDNVPLLSDEFAKEFYGTYAQTLFSTLQADDFKRVIYAWSKNQLDAISVSDLFDVTYKLVRALYDQAPELYDSFIRRYARMYMLRDSVVVRDNILAQYIKNEEEPTFVYNKLLIDGLLASDTLTASSMHILKDTLYVADTIGAVYQWRKTLTDAVSVTDDSLANELAPLVIGLDDFPIIINIGGYKIEVGVDE